MSDKRAVFVTHRTRRGRRDDVHSIWARHMQPAIERNPDHLIYTYTFDPSDPDVIRAFQLYSTADAAASFLTTDPYLAYLSEVDELLIDTEVTVGDEVWHKPNHD